MNSLDLNLFFPVGLPKGHEIIRAGITLEAKLLGITPNSGAAAGTFITVDIPGVGTLTQNVQIQQANGFAICDGGYLTVVEYGKGQCWTKINDMNEL